MPNEQRKEMMMNDDWLFPGFFKTRFIESTKNNTEPKATAPVPVQSKSPAKWSEVSS